MTQRAGGWLIVVAARLAALLLVIVLGATPSTSAAVSAYGYDAQARAGSASTTPSANVASATTFGGSRSLGSFVSMAGALRGFSAAEDAAGGLAPIAGGAEITGDDLTGGAAANYGRFLKSLPASAEEPTITGLPGGGFKFEADVPASNIPGSYATYTKEIDGDGVTTTFYRTTYAPDGSVVNVKVKVTYP